MRRGGPAAGGELSCTAWRKEGVQGETRLPHRCPDSCCTFLKLRVPLFALLAVFSLLRELSVNFLLTCSTSTPPILPPPSDPSPRLSSLIGLQVGRYCKMCERGWARQGQGCKMFGGKRSINEKLRIGDAVKEDPRRTQWRLAWGKRKRRIMINMETFGNRNVPACFHSLSLSSTKTVLALI